MPPIPSKQRQQQNKEKPESKKIRPTKIAINPLDLGRLDPLEVRLMLDDKLDLKGAVSVDPSKADERGVIFTCDLLTAAQICDRLRNVDTLFGKAPARVYLKRGSNWEKVADDEQVSVSIGEQTSTQTGIKPPPVRGVKLGGKPAKGRSRENEAQGLFEQDA